jgi:hypothetical protein
VLEVDYDDEMPWPIAADGAGHSLVLTKPDYGEGDVRAWEQSPRIGGAPGYVVPEQTGPLEQLRINEFLAHTDLPQVDFIEIHNYGTGTVDITGCILTDHRTQHKHVITNGVMAPNSFRAFMEDELGFRISMSGGDIYLIRPDGKRVLDAVRYEAQANGVSMGRWPDGAGAFHALSAVTPGVSNTTTTLLRDAVVINEIMYNPISGDDDDKYIELYNSGSNAVDMSYWRFTAGVDFVFPSGTILSAGGYLVVGRNVANLRAKYPQLNSANSIGDYSGRLSNRGERIALSRPDDLRLPEQDFVVVDEVTYCDGWGDGWPDGRGSSLELIDPRSDNRHGMNWAASDETQKAPWTYVDYEDRLDHGSGGMDEIRLFMLQDGECLVDDLEVSTVGGGVNFASNFDQGLGPWQRWGNHARSAHSMDGYNGTGCLLVRASGSGDNGVWSGQTEPFWNRCSAPFSVTPTAGQVIRIRAKVRWLKGWPHMVIATKGFWAETSVTMELPPDLGSPGLPNSRRVDNAGPAIRDVQHSPVLPPADTPLRVECRVDDPDGVASVTLKYRVEPSTTVVSVSMRDDGEGGDSYPGDGIYTGVIPGQPAGTRIAFVVEAGDGQGATSRFPGDALDGAPPLECIVQFGQSTRAGGIGTLQMWMSDINFTRWTTISGDKSKWSNEPIDVTLAVGDYRVIYNAGARWRGLWRPYSNPTTQGAYSLDIPKSERLLGSNDLTLDQAGQNGGDGTRLREAVGFWLMNAMDVPACRVRFVHLYVNGSYRNILHDLHTAGRDLSESWFRDDDPWVFKNSGWMGDPFGLYLDRNGQHKQSRYRWNLNKRRTSVPDDDYRSVYDLADAFATQDNALYDARVGALVDVRSWISHFAGAALLGDWDHYGYSYAHNMAAYVPRGGRSGLLLYDLDHAFSSGTSSSLFPTGHVVPPRFTGRPWVRRLYWAFLKEAAEGPMAPSRVNAFFEDWTAVFAVSEVSASSPDGWKSWIAGRRNYIISQLATVAAQLSITTNDGADYSTANRVVTLEGTAPVEIETLRLNGLPHRVKYTSVNAWQMDVALQPGANVLTIDGLLRGGGVATNASATITVNYTGEAVSPAGKLVINEIMYHSKELNGDYLELHNISNDRLHLGGLRLRGVDFTFEQGAFIEPNGYVVVAESAPAYQHIYGNAEVLAGEYSGTLSKNGETISLLMPSGDGEWIEIDGVRYDNQPPWPVAAAGQGPSLQLVDATQDNSRVGNWRAAAMVDEGGWFFMKRTGTTTGSTFQMPNATVQFYLDGPGEVWLDNVWLVDGGTPMAGANRIANGGFEEALSGPWTAAGNHGGSVIGAQAAHSGNGGLRLISSGVGSVTSNAVIQGSLGLSPSGTYTLSYWYYKDTVGSPNLNARVVFTDIATNHLTATELNPVLYTPGAANNVAAPGVALPRVWINELMVDNAFAPDGNGDYDPWLELFNAEAGPVDLSAGYYLTDDYNDLTRWAFPAGWTVGAGGYQVVWADGETWQTTADELHAGIALSSPTGQVALVWMNGNEPVVLDYVNYGGIPTNTSFGFYPDGLGEGYDRQIFHYPTPGTQNNPTSVVVRVRINEWMARNSTTLTDPADGRYDDWFELYNAGDDTANLAGYTLTDNLSNPGRYTIPLGTLLGAGEYMLVWADGEPEQNGPGVELHVNFSLAGAGEAIGLFAPDGTAVDTVVFGAQLSDIAEGRWPDGGDSVWQMAVPTPRGPNVLFVLESAATPASNTVELSWNAYPGRRYRLYSAEVLGTNWTPHAEVYMATGSVISATVTNDGITPRYYRVGQEL